MDFTRKHLTAVALTFSALASGCVSIQESNVKAADEEFVCMEYSPLTAAGLGSRFARIAAHGEPGREVEYTRLTRGACAVPGEDAIDRVVVYEGPESGITHTRQGKQGISHKDRYFIPI
jgi:hypothetical protein